MLSFLLALDPPAAPPAPASTGSSQLDSLHQILLALITLMTAMAPFLKTWLEARGRQDAAQDIERYRAYAQIAVKGVEAAASAEAKGATKAESLKAGVAEGFNTFVQQTIAGQTGPNPPRPATPGAPPAA